uniref:Uncharacterized protein n=1 Tax=Oryza glumipatula TaxID=40148 RepID=A0A0D9ZBL9_9ORYZ
MENQQHKLTDLRLTGSRPGCKGRGFIAIGIGIGIYMMKEQTKTGSSYTTLQKEKYYCLSHVIRQQANYSFRYQNN